MLVRKLLSHFVESLPVNGMRDCSYVILCLRIVIDFGVVSVPRSFERKTNLLKTDAFQLDEDHIVTRIFGVVAHQYLTDSLTKSRVREKPRTFSTRPRR